MRAIPTVVHYLWTTVEGGEVEETEESTTAGEVGVSVDSKEEGEDH